MLGPDHLLPVWTDLCTCEITCTGASLLQMETRRTVSVLVVSSVLNSGVVLYISSSSSDLSTVS